MVYVSNGNNVLKNLYSFTKNGTAFNFDKNL